MTTALIGCFSYKDQVTDYIQEDGEYIITNDSRTIILAALGCIKIRDCYEPMIHPHGEYGEDISYFMPNIESLRQLANITKCTVHQA
jgi:hypothetical protein